MLNGSDSMFPVNNRSAAAFLKRKDCSAWISHNGLQESQWWRFPKSWGYQKKSSKSLDYDLVLKQSWAPNGSLMVTFWSLVGGLMQITLW